MLLLILHIFPLFRKLLSLGIHVLIRWLALMGPNIRKLIASTSQMRP